MSFDLGELSRLVAARMRSCLNETPAYSVSTTQPAMFFIEAMALLTISFVLIISSHVLVDAFGGVRFSPN